MEKALYLGIDIGTSAMKLLLMDEDKKILAQTTEEYAVAQPQKGWSEINPDIWYTCMKSGINRILKDCDRKTLRGIGVTGQMHTLIVIGKDGRPLRPAIMWNDLRTNGLLPDLRETIRGFEEGGYLAQTISTGSPAVNLYWMSRYEPEVFSRIWKFLIGPDYLTYRLTGIAGTDFCEASTSCLYLNEKKTWSEEMRKLIGLREEMYPEVRGAACRIGTVLPELAAELDIPEDVNVIAGTGDNPATAVSTGCLVYGYPVISLGTSGVLVTAVPEFKDIPTGKRILFSFDGNECRRLVQGAVQSNGSTMDWWLRSILGEDDFSALDKYVAPDKAKECPVLFYPHICGDKTLYGDPKLRGAFFGLSLETRREDLLYGVVEGICFAFRELAERMHVELDKIDSIKVVGGGAKSRIWMQVLANVLNVCVEQMAGQMNPAFGIALLAAYGCGSLKTLKEMAEGSICIRQTFIPDPELAACCVRRYACYLRMHDALKYVMDGPYPEEGGRETAMYSILKVTPEERLADICSV